MFISNEYPYYTDTVTIDDLWNYYIGDDIDYPAPLPQAGLEDLYWNSLNYYSFNITLYLSKGEHFLMRCNDVSSAQYAKNDTKGLKPWCSWYLALFNMDFLTDNITIVMQALECDFGPQLGLTNNVNFQRLCVDFAAGDERPLVHVNSPSAYFNITGQMTIKNLRFSGINALATPKSPLFVPQVFNVQLCSHTGTPTGIDEVLSLNKLIDKDTDKNATFQVTYSCSDSSTYTGSSYPTSNDMTSTCSLNSYSQFYGSSRSTLRCKGNPNSENFFSLVSFSSSYPSSYAKRRYTLFNIYGFAEHHTFKNVTPELYIENCEFSYFLSNYESLINIETNSFSSINAESVVYSGYFAKTYSQRTTYIYNAGDRGAKITLNSTTLQHSRFCKGAIVYRKAPYDLSSRGLLNLTHLFMTTPNMQSDGYIKLYKSTFINLNAYSNVTALAIYGGQQVTTQLDSNSIDPVNVQVLVHKGIVLNVEDFNGEIEIIGCTFKKNMHFIPQIFYSYHSNGDYVNAEQFKDSLLTLEYQLSICGPTTYTDYYFFGSGFDQSSDIDSMFVDFERLTTVYISRNMKQIIIKDNTFTKNIGTFGGAIAINSMNWDDGTSPYVLIYNNVFNQNKAYFSGNAIYIRNTMRNTALSKICAGVTIQQNTFTYNTGMKMHNGGAVSAICDYLDSPNYEDYKKSSSITKSSSTITTTKITSITDSTSIKIEMYKFVLKDNYFEQNFSGMKGTAVYLKQISDIFIYNCTFLKNGPLTFVMEYLYSPYVIFFSGRAMSFYSKDCFDEYDYLVNCNNVQNTYIDFPRVQGALYVGFCQSSLCMNNTFPQTLELSKSYFVKNEAGPIIEYRYSSEYATASQIHIEGGFTNYIHDCEFTDNKGTLDWYNAMEGNQLSKLFPDGYKYFYFSQSSLINIYLYPSTYLTPIIMNTTIQNCKFYRNKNIQVLGLTDDEIYHGSLVKAVNYGTTSSSFTPLLNISNCDVKDNVFYGKESSLIYTNNVITRISSNTFINNGYLSSTTYEKYPTQVKITSKYYDFVYYQFQKAQYYGILWVDGDSEFPSGQTHQFISNTFQYSFCMYGCAYALGINLQYAYMYGNTYKYMIAQYDGGILKAFGSSGYSTIFMDKESASYIYSTLKGALTITPTAQDLQSLYVNNSYFNTLQSHDGSVCYMDKAAKTTIQNTVFTRTNFHKDTAAYIQSQFKQYFTIFSGFVDTTLFKQIVNEVTQLTGYICAASTYNSKAINLGQKVLYNSSYPYLGYIEIIDSDFYNNIALYSVLIDCSVCKFRIANTFGGKTHYIQNNTGYQAGPIGMYYSSQFVGENLYFFNNTSQAKASAFYMSESTALITNATFIKNNAAEIGTVVVETNSDFKCYQCNFYNNYAYDSSGIFTYNNKHTTVQIINNKYVNNTSVYNLISLQYSQTKIINSIFIDNISQKVNNGITMINSISEIRNIIVNFTNTDYVYNNQYNVDVCFFSLNYQSYIYLYNSQVQYCRGSIASLMYATGSSSIYMYNNTLQNIESRTGSVMYISMAENVTIDNVRFLQNTQSDFYIESTDVTIQNSYFYQGMQQFIYAYTASLVLINNTFADGTNYNTYGKALYCYCIGLNAYNNTFRNLSAVQGGAIYLTSLPLSSFTLKKNTFSQNTAQEGGALYIQSANYLDILGNLFEKNSAIVISPTTTESAKLSSKGQGGAILYACSNDDIVAKGGCVVNIKQNNVFRSNYAKDDGGAIHRVSYAYNDDNTNSFINNTAYYGGDVASYPSDIKIEVISNGDYINSYTSNDTSLRILAVIGTLPTFVSGTPFSFNVYILDQNGNVYNTDSSSKCTFKYAGTSGSEDVILINNEVIANQGVYYFVNTQVNAKPGSDLTFKLEITGLTTYDNSISFVDVPVSLSVSLRECVAGEEYTSDNRCRVCPAGTYLYYPPSSETACKDCPSHATCYGKNIVAPEPSYWRSSNVSENFILCQNVDACLGGDQNNTMGKCSAGYTGIICGDCDNNYSKTKQFTCAGCPERVKNIVQISFIVIAAAAYVVFLVRSTLNSADKPKPVYSVYLKIITNHFQVLSAISNIDYKWPAQIQKFEENQNSVSSVSDQVFSFDCFFMNNGKDDGPLPVYYQKLTMYGLLPLVLSVSDILFWLALMAFRNRKVRGYKFEGLKSNFTSALVVLLFLVHPNISKAMFLSFNCTEIDGVYRLKENIKSICYQDEHLTYMLIISIPSVFIWALGIPLFALFLLVANRKTLYMQDYNPVTETEHRKIVEVKMKYGFIFAGYKGKTYYWEVILLYRKLGIIMATVFLSTFSNEAQVLAVMLIIVICLLLQINYNPYYTDILNQMEIYSLQVSAITLYAGMYYVTGQHYSYMDNNGLAWFFLTFIITPNAVFLIYWGYYMRVEVLKEVYNRRGKHAAVSKVFKCLSCSSLEVFEKTFVIPHADWVKPQDVVPDDQIDREKEKNKKDEQPDCNDEEEPVSYELQRYTQDSASQLVLDEINISMDKDDKQKISPKKYNGKDKQYGPLEKKQNRYLNIPSHHDRHQSEYSTDRDKMLSDNKKEAKVYPENRFSQSHSKEKSTDSNHEAIIQIQPNFMEEEQPKKQNKSMLNKVFKPKKKNIETYQQRVSRQVKKKAKNNQKKYQANEVNENDIDLDENRMDTKGQLNDQEID